MSDFWTHKKAIIKLDENGSIDGDLANWLAEKAQNAPYPTPYVLAHFLDGVNWGYFDGTQWKFSHDVCEKYAPKFRKETLIELRMFGQDAEYHLWRDGNGNTFRGRWLTDADVPDDDENGSYDENQILWGTMAHDIADSRWKKMTDGEQGLVHIIPPFDNVDTLPKVNGDDRPLRLKIRHYVECDPDVRVVVSRLVSLSSEPKTKGGQK